MPKTGLVLSGGAAWGLANVGVLDVFEREKFPIDCIAGSSMGSIIAGAYALGVPLTTIHETIRSLSTFAIARPVWPPFRGGFHGGLFRHRVDELLRPVIGDALIGDCRIPFLCPAARVRKPIVWSRIFRKDFAERFLASIEYYVFPPETRLLDAMMASSAVPVIFAPAHVSGDTFIDLLYMGAVPARRLHDACHPDILIGTDTNPRHAKLQNFLPSGFRELLRYQYAELDADLRACNVVITPTMPAAEWRFGKGEAFIEAGRKAAEGALPALRLNLST
ncbi:MAG: patatin-like phospholipase family protein [Candidatus Peribacteraceae bacterium]|nr:patatin-like phospholipase family protein [Candidatus Peribacteraceae bacterium]